MPVTNHLSHGMAVHCYKETRASHVESCPRLANTRTLTMRHHLSEDSFANIKLILNFFVYVTTCGCTILDCLVNHSL
jgi:hypothetical protein